MSETSAGNTQAYDTERGNPRQATSTVPYNEQGTGPLPGRKADRPAADHTAATPRAETGSGPLPIEAAAFGRPAAAPVGRAAVETAQALEPLPSQGASAPLRPVSYGMQPRLSSPTPAPASPPATLAPPAPPPSPVPAASAAAAPAQQAPAAEATDPLQLRTPWTSPPQARAGTAAAQVPAADSYGAAKSDTYGARTRGYDRPAAMPAVPDDEITVLPAPVAVAEQVAAAGPPPVAVVKGRVQIEDEVVEKVAGLAAVEVAGVADLGGNIARAFEAAREHLGVGHRRGTQGVRARIEDRQVAIHVVIVIEYGAVVMEVAKAVKANVARAVSHMLGLRVVEVNVTVDDVAMPRHPAPARAPEPADAEQVTDPFA